MPTSEERYKEFCHSFVTDAKRKYDPVKRKEYYERTKELKGRAKTFWGSQKRPTKSRSLSTDQRKKKFEDLLFKLDAELNPLGESTDPKDQAMYEKLVPAYEALRKQYVKEFPSKPSKPQPKSSDPYMPFDQDTIDFIKKNSKK